MTTTTTTATTTATASTAGTLRGYNWEKALLRALLNSPVTATRSGYASIGGRRALELWKVRRFLTKGLMTDRKITYTEAIGSTPSSFDSPVASYGHYTITPAGREEAARLGLELE